MSTKSIYITVGAILFALFGVSTLLAVQNSDDDSNELKVATTIFPLADATERIAGDDFEVVQLLPAGQSPHSFDPSPGTIAELSDATTIFSVGTWS